jgi:hypothetical protein
VKQIEGGVLVFTGPTRRTYIDRPPGMSATLRPGDRTRPGAVRFEPAEDEEAPGF